MRVKIFELHPLAHTFVFCPAPRLVEVADYNMNIRPRLTWSQIWENMGSHFAKGKFVQLLSSVVDSYHVMPPLSYYGFCALSFPCH